MQQFYPPCTLTPAEWQVEKAKRKAICQGCDDLPECTDLYCPASPGCAHWKIRNIDCPRGKWTLKLPSWRAQATNAMKAAARVATAVAMGEPVRLTKAEYKLRKEICGTCEFRTKNRCVKCGCYWTAKAALKTETCPEGRWPELKLKE